MSASLRRSPLPTAAAVGQPAYVTTAVADILGTSPRSFRQWAADHAAAFTESPAGS
ncbi:hypothetical protein [Streptacidiphilus albus]|uniref:hypothetical protein n=1 Tax=Streptacidiphilus albus TaxID=105425 RepID=UPI000A67FDFA|nr:hypothetical protein [Streptacidiphilus albus]